MVCVPFSSLKPNEAAFWLNEQKKYSPAQVSMARSHPHLVWVNPRNKCVPRQLRLDVYRRDEGVCPYCQAALPETDFTVDHVIPVAEGGPTKADNLVVACRPCNSSKGARHPDEWRCIR